MSAWEDRCFAVPKGQARIAQRFNAGLDAQSSRVPKGRPKPVCAACLRRKAERGGRQAERSGAAGRSNPTRHPSAVPSGLVCLALCFPALKRRAILKMSLRDKGTCRPPFPPNKQADSLAMPSRAFRGYGVQPGSCGIRSSPWEMVRVRGIRLPCRAPIRTVPASVKRCGTAGSVPGFSR